MDDRLTYKIGEVCGMQLSSFFVNFVTEALYKFGEAINESLPDLLQSLQFYFNDSEEQYKIEYKRNQLIAMKAIKPTHKAPIYRIIPYVRNRC